MKLSQSYLATVMTVSEQRCDWMILMEGAGPGLIAVRVVECKYAGCCVDVDSMSCAVVINEVWQKNY